MTRTAAPRRARSARPRHAPAWANFSDAELLELRLRDLDLRIEGTPLEARIATVHAELEAADLRPRPHFWLSTSWFAPDGVPGAAVPFYLAHPRLARLERAQMLEVEGASRATCLALLRHETAHALDSAHRLHTRPDWRATFGRNGERYPRFFRPRPVSRDHVQHLSRWYAQGHPAEDWAETFAVWLDPRSDWRARYAGWPALAKLEYVERLMGELAGRAPAVRSRERTEHVGSLSITLGEHYARRRARAGRPRPQVLDRELAMLFAPAGKHGRGVRAQAFLARVRARVRREVARWTGESAFALDLCLRDMGARARALELVLTKDEEQTERNVALALATATMNFLHDGHHRLAP